MKLAYCGCWWRAWLLIFQFSVSIQSSITNICMFLEFFNWGKWSALPVIHLCFTLRFIHCFCLIHGKLFQLLNHKMSKPEVVIYKLQRSSALCDSHNDGSGQCLLLRETVIKRTGTNVVVHTEYRYHSSWSG